MSYSSVNQCANDPAFMARVNAAIAQEQLAKGEDVNPWQFSTNMCWAVSAASGRGAGIRVRGERREP